MSEKRINWKYAAGEILIVSIGILIAFSINTWSSTIQDLNARKEYRHSLITDLEQNLINLDRIAEAQNTKIKELSYVVDEIEKGIVKPGDIGEILFRQRKSPTFYPINGTFKTLESHGGIKLFSKDLQSELFNLYDTNYERTVYNGVLYDKVFLDLYDMDIRALVDFRTKEIDDFEMLKSKAFLKDLTFIIDEASSYLVLLENTRSGSEYVLDLIKSD